MMPSSASSGSRYAGTNLAGLRLIRHFAGTSWVSISLTPYRCRSREIAGIQSIYLMATGLWPLAHRRSFEAVTGRKREFWLVRTVGGLAAACGTPLGVSVICGRQPTEIQLLAGAQALVFVTADVFAAKTQSRLYLGDLVLHAACLPSWFVPWEFGAS